MSRQATDTIRSAARVGARHLPWLDRLTLAALAVAVVAVTIPRLRAMAMRANERDARAALGWLGAELAALPPASLQTELAGILSRLPVASRRFSDARVLASGGLVHHGYVFRSARDATGAPRLLAWPCQAGRTGEHAYAWDAGALFANANRPVAWSGVEHALPLDVDPRRSAGWSPLEPE